MRQVVLDTETTGLDPSQGHKLVEVAGVEIINRQLTGKHLHLYVNPGRDSDPEALQVHGLTTEFLSDYPPFEEVANQLAEFVSGAEVIIHNAPFDLGFLNYELKAAGMAEFESYCASVIDSLTFARELHPGRRNSLDALCERYGISNAHRVLHGALLDSELLADVWLAMTRGQDALMLDSSSRGTESTGIKLGDMDVSKLPVIRATPEEQAKHDAYMQEIKGSA